ncbi:MAG: hypothetical protein QW244_02570 [Candidatus Pacearchaeota archaeon]
MERIEIAEIPVGQYIYKCINEDDESLFEPIYLLLKDRRNKTKENLERIVRLFIPENKFKYVILEKRSEYAALLKNQKVEKDMRYDMEIDMKYYPINTKDIEAIITRVKKSKSFLDKVIKKKIFGIAQKIEKEIPNFLKFGVDIICLESEIKTLKEGITNSYASLKSRIRTSVAVNSLSKYDGILKKLILKTDNVRIHEKIREIPGCIIKTLQDSDICKVIKNYIEDQKNNEIKSELCIDDLGGVNFVLKYKIFGKEFYKLAESIISRIGKYFCIKECVEKKEKSGYNALHYNLRQPNVIEGIEVRFTDKESLENNEFGNAYLERYKENLNKVNIPKEKQKIIKGLYNYIMEKENEEKQS